MLPICLRIDTHFIAVHLFRTAARDTFTVSTGLTRQTRIVACPTVEHALLQVRTTGRRTARVLLARALHRIAVVQVAHART